MVKKKEKSGRKRALTPGEELFLCWNLCIGVFRMPENEDYKRLEMSLPLVLPSQNDTHVDF
jgi:hypothetical protein